MGPPGWWTRRSLGDAWDLGGGRLRAGQGPCLVRASEVRSEFWALEQPFLASVRLHFSPYPPTSAVCEEVTRSR